MQRELPSIDFANEAEVRSKAESRRTEEVAGLLKDFFVWWTPSPRRWAIRLRRSGRSLLDITQWTHRPAAVGKS